MYVGSFGGWYLTDEMMDFFTAAREMDPKTFALVLKQRDKEKVSQEFEARGFGTDDFFVTSVAPGDVHRYMAAGDAALSFIKSCYSKQSSSPTKLAEYLACGLPIIANRGVGDVDQLIEENGVGVMLDEFSRENYNAALTKIRELGNVAGQCRETARREFDLRTVGGERYRRLYSSLITIGKT
jgi:glycosyltransferase involved in cell wall biosynthesis